MARDGASKPKAPSGLDFCRLVSAKVLLCFMNVVSFAMAAGLVAVGSRKVRNPHVGSSAPRARQRLSVCPRR